MFEPLGDACGHAVLQSCMLTGKLYVMLTCFQKILTSAGMGMSPSMGMAAVTPGGRKML